MNFGPTPNIMVCIMFNDRSERLSRDTLLVRHITLLKRTDEIKPISCSQIQIRFMNIPVTLSASFLHSMASYQLWRMVCLVLNAHVVRSAGCWLNQHVSFDTDLRLLKTYYMNHGPILLPYLYVLFKNDLSFISNVINGNFFNSSVRRFSRTRTDYFDVVYSYCKQFETNIQLVKDVY